MRLVTTYRTCWECCQKCSRRSVPWIRPRLTVCRSASSCKPIAWLASGPTEVKQSGTSLNQGTWTQLCRPQPPSGMIDCSDGRKATLCPIHSLTARRHSVRSGSRLASSRELLRVATRSAMSNFENLPVVANKGGNDQVDCCRRLCLSRRNIVASNDPRAASSTGQLDHAGARRLRPQYGNGKWPMRVQARHPPDPQVSPMERKRLRYMAVTR